MEIRLTCFKSIFVDTAAVISAKVIVSNKRRMHLKTVVLFVVVYIFVSCFIFLTFSDTSNNHLEEMPPALFSDTINLKELYV